MLGRMAMTLLGGTGTGAALMYLFDPDRGEHHRRQIRRTASDLYGTAAESTAAGWHAVRDQAGPATTRLRARLADSLAGASRAVAPPGFDDIEERMELTPTEARTAVALSRQSREFHGEARHAYAQARDMYYDALVDLDLARTRQIRQAPKPMKERVLKVKARRPDYLKIALVAAGCCAAGAAAMYILDPSAGRRRRALVRDKTYRAAHSAGQAITGSARRARDYSRGKVARVRTALRHEVVPDIKLVARVRSEMGRVVSFPSAIGVLATNGSVTLRGPVLASEFDALMKCVYSVPGVREVINQTETHAAAEELTGL